MYTYFRMYERIPYMDTCIFCVQHSLIACVSATYPRPWTCKPFLNSYNGKELKWKFNTSATILLSKAHTWFGEKKDKACATEREREMQRKREKERCKERVCAFTCARVCARGLDSSVLVNIMYIHMNNSKNDIYVITCTNKYIYACAYAFNHVNI